MERLGVESKDDAADSVKRGRLKAADKNFQDVRDLYEPFESDATLSAFLYQIYESMSDAAARFRSSTQMNRLSVQDQAEVMRLERGWHRTVISNYTNNPNNTIRLAAALRRWNEFARAVHCRVEWPTESINSAKKKSPPSLLGDLTDLHGDVAAVVEALVSAAVTPGLTDRIDRNLAVSPPRSPTDLEKKQLRCYRDLVEFTKTHRLDDGNLDETSVDDIRLDDLDRSISAFQYFHHPDSGK